MRKTLSAVIVSLVALQLAVPVRAEVVEGPKATRFKPAVLAEREVAIRKARACIGDPNGLGSAERGALVAKLRTFKNLDSQSFRDFVACVPLQERAKFYVEKAAAAGQTVGAVTRTVSGRLSVDPNRPTPVISSQKLFVEVIPGTLNLWRQIMGPNTIVPAGPERANHLYTFYADQGKKKGLYVGTYGESANPATVTNGQFGMPVALTDRQMARFCQYLNAGIKNGRSQVYGFFAERNGTRQQVSMACTNWQSAAPIGDLAARYQALEDAVKELKLVPRRDASLHAALSAAKTPAARKAIVAKVSRSRRLSAEHRESLKALAQEFADRDQYWPKRAADLVGRTALGPELGLSRADHPGIWLLKLLINSQNPVVAVFNTEARPDFASREFSLTHPSTSGATFTATLGVDGRVTGTSPAAVPVPENAAPTPARN